jgi:hypothetical protein
MSALIWQTPLRNASSPDGKLGYFGRKEMLRVWTDMDGVAKAEYRCV